MVLGAIAAAGIAALLATDAKIHVPLAFSASAVSAASLLLIGVSFLIVQAIQRPPRAELLKNVLLAGAFLLWGVVQLMRQSDLSKKLGDVVIALYVVDLAWVIFATLHAQREVRPERTKQ
jgi:Ca2+/Na+ antiporter